MTLHTKKTTIRTLFATSITNPPPPKYTATSPVVTVKEGMELKKQIKTNIGVGSVVMAKVGELEKITREQSALRDRKSGLLW